MVSFLNCVGGVVVGSFFLNCVNNYFFKWRKMEVNLLSCGCLFSNLCMGKDTFYHPEPKGGGVQAASLRRETTHCSILRVGEHTLQPMIQHVKNLLPRVRNILP